MYGNYGTFGPDKGTHVPAIEDYSPDRQPSYSATFIKQTPTGKKYFLQVKGLGVMAIDCEQGIQRYPTPLTADWMSKAEIGPCPEL